MLRIWKSRPLLVIALSVMAGAIITSHVGIAWMPALGAAALLFGGAVWARGKGAFPALVILCALFLGVAAVSHSNVLPAPPAEGMYLLEGTVAGKVRETAGGNSALVIENVRMGGRKVPYRVQMFITGEAQLSYGDRVSFTGRVWHPQGRRNPGGFDYRAYLWRQDILFCASAEEVFAEPSTGISLLGMIYNLRQSLLTRADVVFEETAPLMKALLLGERSDLPEEVVQGFEQTGIVHLLSLSGLHVMIVAQAVLFLLRRLGISPRVRFFALCALLALFMFLTGFSISVRRAAFMLVLLHAGKLLGRQYDSATAVSAVFLLFVLVDPRQAGDGGLILSFGAVAGIVFLQPTFRLPYAGWIREKGRKSRAVRYAGAAADSVAVTLAAQIGTLPAMSGLFGAVPLFATLANVFAVPLCGIMIPYGLAGLVIGVFLPGAAWVLMRPLVWMQWVLFELPQKLPMAELLMPPWPLILVLAFAMLAVCASQALAQRPALRLGALGMCCLAAGLWWGYAAFVPLSHPEIVFLDVGQADSAVLRIGTKAYVVDTGSTGSETARYLRHIGKRPEAVFLSHPHDDHAGGYEEVIRAAKPGAVYLPAGWDRVLMDELSGRVLALSKEKGIAVRRLSAGEVLSLAGGGSVLVLGPGENTRLDANAISMVLYVQTGAGNALFCGDLPSGDEPLALPPAMVLKVPHHGNGSSMSERMMHAVSPAVAVISVGARNAYGHPAEATLKRAPKYGAKVYRTDDSGAVRIVFPGEGKVKAVPFLPGP